MAKDDDNNWGRNLGLGIEMAVGVGFGLAVGWWIDDRYGSAPWGVLIGTLLGLAAGMYLLIKQAMRMNKD